MTPIIQQAAEILRNHGEEVCSEWISRLTPEERLQAQEELARIHDAVNDMVQQVGKGFQLMVNELAPLLQNIGEAFQEVARRLAPSLDKLREGWVEAGWVSEDEDAE